MTVYETNVSTDVLLVRWYEHLAATGDLEDQFSRPTRSLGSFMEYVKASVFIYEADDDGIWFAAWFTPALGAVAFHYWMRREVRGGDAGLRALIEALRFGLRLSPVLLAAIRANPGDVAAFQVLGFVTLGGVIPGIFEDNAMSVSYLDREHFFGDEHAESVERR